VRFSESFLAELANLKEARSEWLSAAMVTFCDAGLRRPQKLSCRDFGQNRLATVSNDKFRNAPTETIETQMRIRVSNQNNAPLKKSKLT
jgi:hypothetical protein